MHNSISNSFFRFKIYWILLCVPGLELSAQQSYLMLQKRNTHKNVYYQTGDEITFYRETKNSTKGKILAFEDSIIVFQGYRVHVNEITALHIDEKTRWWIRYKPAQLLLICGTGYLALSAINDGELENKTLAISGGMIGTGLLFKLFVTNRIKIRGRIKLRVIHL